MSRRQGTGSLIGMLPGDSVGAEVGVWRGDFSAVVLERVRPRLLHLIDPWVRYEDPAYEGAKYGCRKSEGYIEDAYREVLDRFGEQISSGQIVIHRKASSEAVTDIADRSLDWVYIDGNHAYEYVKADLEMYAPKLNNGGLLCGDDYVMGGWWGDGVIRAVDEFAREAGLEVEFVGETQFLMRV